MARLGPSTGRTQFHHPLAVAPPASYPGYTTLWQEIKVAMGCAAIFLMPAIMAAIIVILKAIVDLLGMPFH